LKNPGRVGREQHDIDVVIVEPPPEAARVLACVDDVEHGVRRVYPVPASLARHDVNCIHRVAIDIDEGGAFPAHAEDPHAALDIEAHSEARHVVDRIDGETLEELGRLWYRGKGWPEPEDSCR
jgi:hypothetical protein